MPLIVTDHACRRYLERVDPSTDPEQAIRQAMRSAVKLTKPARDGCAFWRAARFVLICLDVGPDRIVRTVIGLEALERAGSTWTRARHDPPKPTRKAPRPYRHPRRP